MVAEGVVGLPLSVEAFWKPDRARALIRSSFRRNQQLIAKFRAEFDEEDIVSQVQLQAQQSWARYDPWSAAASTFIDRITRNVIANLSAKRQNDSKRQASRRDELNIVGGEIAAADPAPEPSAPALRWDDGALSIEQWVKTIRTGCVKFLSRERYWTARRRRHHSKLLALGLLCCRRKLSASMCRMMLQSEGNEPLLAALGFKSVPSERAIRRAKRAAREVLGGNPPRSVRGRAA